MSEADTTIIVCADRGHFADDVDAMCARCGCAIQHRPHVPADATKLCIRCAADHVRAERAAGREPEHRITPETARELELYFAKGGKA